MKILKQIKKVSFLIFLLTFVSATSFAQVYVDATNGNDVTGSGTAVAPYASIAKGLSAMDKSGGTLVLKAGTYTGAGLASTGDDIIIRKSQVIDGKTQPAWDDNVTITIRLEQLNGNDVVLISDSDPGQAFTFDVKGGTLNIVSASGTEYMNLTGTVTFNLGTNATRSVSLNIGTLNGGGGNITATAGATLNLSDVSAFTGEAPKTTNPVISYLGTGSQTAGAEAQYGAFGTGTITVNKTNNTDIVTFPATAITGVGAINIAKGGATFQAAVTVNADVTVGNGGDVNFTDLNMKNFDFNHGGTGAVAISGGLTFNITDGAAAGNLGQLNVTGGGNFTVSGATEWTEGITADRDFAANSAINLANGNVTLNGVTLSNNNTATRNYTFRFYNNDNNGTLNVGTVTTNSTGSPTMSYGILNVTNNNTGTVSVNGAIRSSVVNSSTGTINVYGTIGVNLTNSVANGKINITGATSVAGVLTNASNSAGANTGYMALTDNILTLSGNSAHLTNGGEITATTGGIVITAGGANSFNGGTLSNVKLNGAGATTFATNAIGVTDLTVTNGTAIIGVATTASGNTTVEGGTLQVGNFAYTTNDFTQTSGTVTLAANAASDLDVNGNFNRTAGTFTAGLASEVLFSGTSTQNVNGGPSFQIASMTVSNTGGLVTIANTIRAIGTITVNTGATVELGNFSLVFNAATGIMVNNGTIQTTGNTNGAVIFGGANFVTAGNNVDGMRINASSSALFSNIIIDVGSANDVITTGSAGNIRWTKKLYLYTGDLNNNSAVDLAPSGADASVERDLSTTAGSVNGVVLGGGGTFDAAAVDYNLTYSGTLTANKTINTTTAVEWDANNVVNLTQSAAGGSFAVILAGNVNRSIKGNLIITGNATAANAARLTGDNGDLNASGNISIGQNSVLTLANNAGTDLSLSGALTVGNSATIITGNAGSVISLAGDNQTHSILGAITAASILTVNGTGVVINGQDAIATASASEIANLTVAATKSATVTKIHNINGAVTTGATSTLSLGLTQPSAASPVDPNNGRVIGLITLGGTSVTLTSAVEAQAGVTHNLGSFAFGSNNLTLSTAGTFVRANAASAVYTSTGGALVSDLLATYDFNGGSIPYWDVKKAITLVDAASDITVEQELDIMAGGSIANGGADVTIQTLMTTVGGVVFTGAGELILAGTEIVASGSPTISNLTVNSTGTATLSSSDEDAAPTWRTYTVTTQLKQTAGNIDIKGNSIVLTGAGAAFDRTAGSWAATTGILSFAGAADQAFDPGTGWSVPNLTINNTSGSGTEVTTDDNEVFTVTGILNLTDGVLHTLNGAAAKDGLLTLGDGAIVKRDAAKSSVASIPAFGTTNDFWYITAGGNTAKELPLSTTVVNDVRVSVATVFDADVTINGTLFLIAGAVSEGAGDDITMATGATINRTAGTMAVAPKVTSYNLIYSNGANVTTGPELVGASVANLSVLSTGGFNVALGTAVTMSGDLVLNGATTATQLNLNGNNLTTAGNVTITKGDIVNSTGTLSKFTFSGTAAQTLTVPAAGLVFPSITGAGAGGAEFVLNNTSTAGVTLAGGNLTMQNTAPAANLNIVRFINGNLTTTNALVLTLWQAATATNKPHQGFDRTGVDIANNKYSHVVGNVEKYVNNTAGTSIDRSEVVFPVGTAAASPGNYRPASFFFKTAPQSALNLTVNHDEENPGGENGFPITSGSKKITNYPDFFWYVKSDQALAPSYKYDVEFQAEGYSDYITDGIEDLRLIRRDSGNVANNWVLQGLDGNYDNSTINATWPVAKVIDAQGGITTQGSKFSYSQLNKAPYFTATLANASHPTIPGAKIGGQVAATEGAALTGTYTSTDPDLGQTATMFLVAKPDSATFNTGTGAFAWTPDNTTAPGPYYVTIGSTDGTDTSTVTDTINVTDVNQLPYFTAAPAAAVTVGEGAEYNFTYTAEDPDADNTSLTFSIQALTGTAPDSISLNPATGELVIIPLFGQVGDQFDLTVRVTDGAGGTADTLSAFTVADVNRAPSFTAELPDTTIDENQALAFTYTATDPDAGDVLTFSLGAAAPTGATIDGTTGDFAWTPSFTQAGMHTFKVWVTDDGTPNMSDSSEVTITVNDVNSPPVWTVELDADTVFVGDTFSYTYEAEDLDNDELTYSFILPKPGAMSQTKVTNETVLVEWSPVVADTATYLIRQIVSDGMASDTTMTLLTVLVTTVDVNGVVSYNGSAELLDAVTVTLSDGTNDWTDVTDATGAYSFMGVATGEYTITAAKTTQWGGALASDALETQLYVVNPDSNFLNSDLQKVAADVVGVGNITSSDALAILNRSVGIDDFQIADWQFETVSVSAGTQDITQNLMGIAAGDARSDYSPALGLAKVSNIAVNSDEVLNIKKESEFELPISIAELVEIGSFTFKLKYDLEKVEFLGVSTEIGGTLVANVVEDVISIAWVNLGSKEINVKDGDALATLKFKATELFSKADELSLELLDGAEMTDRLAKNINSGINIPVVAIGIPDVFALRQNYPNPFNPSTTIQYDLPENGKVTLTVYNSLGQRVGTLVNTKQVAGAYEINFNASNLASGVYLYRVTVEGSKNFVMTKKMILMK